MGRAFRVIWLAIKDLFDEFLLLIFVSVTWSLVSLPLLLFSYALLGSGFAIEATIAALLAVLPLAPATVALSAVAAQVRDGIVTQWRGYLAAIRHYARVAWRGFGLWYLGLLIIVVDILFYSNMANLVGTTLTLFWFYMLLIWLSLLIYVPALIVMHEEAGVKQQARLAFALVFGRPLFTLTVLVVSIVLAVMSILLPLLLVLITPGLLALIGVRATKQLLDEAEEARRAAEEAQPGVELSERGRRGQVRPRE